MEAREYLGERAARAGTAPVLGSMWGRLVHCGDRWVQDRAELVTNPLSPAASLCACFPDLQNPLQESRGLVLGDRGVGAWAEASSVLRRASSWAGRHCKKKMSEPWHTEGRGAGARGCGRTEGQRARTALPEPGGTEASEKLQSAQVAHLGEAALEAPQAAVEGQPLGGLTVLGELQGGSKLMTRRPQAAMLRFIWEALRKSWPRGGRRGGAQSQHLQWPAQPSPCSL